MSYRQQSKRAAFADLAKRIRWCQSGRNATQPEYVTLKFTMGCAAALDDYAEAARRAAESITGFGAALGHLETVVLPDGREVSVEEAMRERLKSMVTPGSMFGGKPDIKVVEWPRL
jgi:hypothetical protein